MRIFIIILIAAFAGAMLGGGAAYVDARIDPDAPGLPNGTSAPTPELVKADERSPRVEVDQPHFNFGTMQRGTTKSHEFVIRNVGTAPLTLRVGQTSCKCTLGDVTNRPVPPGESTRVKLEWNAKVDLGPFRQTAMIHTNDPVHSIVELTIEGEILDTSGVQPSEFMFDKIQVGEEKTAEVYVMAMLQDELKVRDAVIADEESRDKFVVEVEPVEQDELPDPRARDGIRLKVTAKPGLPVGRLYQWVTLNTNLAEAETLEIPIVGRVVGDISVYGTGWNEEQGVLTIGRVKSSEGKKVPVNVMVRGPGAENVKVDVQSVDPPEMKVTVGKPKKLRAGLLHVPVEIEVPAGTRPMVRLNTAQGEEARVVLTTTHPKISELTLGVRFSVER
jgi:hypothetical protein